MTRILHTSDTHLAVDHPERLEALRQVLNLAEQTEADILTIGGDLFDSGQDAEQLRPELRDEFSGRSYRILAIPGNHDHEAYRGDLYFGSDFTILLQSPFEVAAEGGVRFFGVPFTPRLTQEIRLLLRNREEYEGPEVLLIHGSLEAPFEERYAGDEEARYCPITEAGIDALGFDYVLAGHYHNVHEVRLESGATFVYSGSPASVSRNETGPRKAVVVDTDEGTVKTLQLPTFHFDRLELTVEPGQEQKVLERIESWAETRAGRTVDAEVIVEGHTECPEKDFQDSLKAAAGTSKVTNRTRSVERVLAYPLYQQFIQDIDEFQAEKELKNGAKQRILHIFSGLFAQGKIQ